MMRLEEGLCDVRAGFASGDDGVDGVRHLRMNNVTREGEMDFSRVRRVAPSSRQRERQALTVGDVVINVTNSAELIGKSVLVRELSEETLFSNHFLRLRTDKARLYPPYLQHLLRVHFALGTFKSRAKKWVGQATLDRNDLLGLPIPATDLQEQRRIAAILDQADELRAKRRRTLALLDELPERIFAERFLDVGRALNPLGDLAAWQSGGTPSRSQTAFFSGDIPWMTSGELGPVRVMVSNEMLTTEAVARSSAKMIPHGSLLLGMYDTAALKSSISVGRIACNQAVAFGVPSSGVSPEFLYFAVRSQRASVLARRRGARQKNLNLSMIRSITVPVASAAEQAEFADVVHEVEALRAAAEAHLAHLDELFASLQHRAFTGQL
jgi:type I restriction enzyme S subunit